MELIMQSSRPISAAILATMPSYGQAPTSMYVTASSLMRMYLLLGLVANNPINIGREINSGLLCYCVQNPYYGGYMSTNK